ncbi:hypothetical protein [Streptomyces spiramenti]|uniref:Enoyl reductase n=1 Tax=Streptomyces spiramenti TaxID=2720606 RepID=A0ABX1AG52_9ACTN|nr:hypothetical protein [Streptomyces spiramenti]NJP66128.1 hypothetical protein [Streptomyces spiramenti]
MGAATAGSCILVLTVGTAHADDRIGDGNLDPPPSKETGTGHESGEINAQARITFTVTAGGGGTGALKSSTPWEPPACYYAPTHTPEEMARHWRGFYAHTNRDFWPDDMRESFDSSHEERYGEDGEFPEYNRELQGEGMFWTRVINREHPDRQGQMACRTRTFWVDFTEAPEPGPGVVDSTLLAELAWERTRVPDTEVSLNPADVPQKVNLATWIWLDDTAFEPVSIRAELDDYGLWAETTATPARLTLDPGTTYATTHPPGGVCETSDGTIGTPWTPGTNSPPPCGITYTRATTDRSTYPLSAALTWEVTWTDSLGDTGTLPDGDFSTTLDITVEEVQTIVR